MEAENRPTFWSLSENVGRFDPRNKTFLIPQMNRIGAHLLAGTFRSFGINALVMDTYRGLELGKEFTSGKECFPCQVTMGDILYFMQKEKERLGDAFDPERYIYFMPEASGPCRFGMYNKYQRIVLDSFPELRNLKIGSLTTDNAYSLEGMFDKKTALDFRKVAYFSVVVGDILDRLLWRIRPYEREKGSADAFIERSMKRMTGTFETYGARKDFEHISDELEDILREAETLIDPGKPRKPRIGIVGEIYLRTHTPSNQDVIRVLERYGAEVVNASIAEWVNYATYDRRRDAEIALSLELKQLRFKRVWHHLRNLLNYSLNLYYQQSRQERLYERARKIIDLPVDHRVGHLEEILLEDDLFSFDVGTEACLSIAGIIQYAREGYNGIVNVYPFTCMPSTITSSVIKPIMSRMKIPYLDTPYDGTFQPGREAALRTFMYQATQHFQRQGGKGLDKK
ncbi:MAG: CoA activase [Deltaproteobacteria bacterium]|nr:CoA activase [Deltaproteobacteria bacterium]